MALGEISGNKASYQFHNERGQFRIFCYTAKSKKNASYVPMIGRDMKREAERYLCGFKLKRGLLAVVFGVASLALLEKLKEMRNKDGGEILVIESDSILVTYLLEHKPNYLKDLLILTPESIDLLDEYTESLEVDSIIGYRIFKNAAAIQLEEKFYFETERAFKNQFSSRLSDLFTRLEFEPRWILNSLSQIAKLNQAKAVNILYNLNLAMPVILVSSGPSLRSALALIKKYRDVVFVACVDSAYRILLRSNIIPDLVFSLDSQAHTLRHFTSLPQVPQKLQPVLVADLVANPQVTFRWQGQLLYSLTAQYSESRSQETVSYRMITPGSDYVEKYIQLTKKNTYIGDIQSGGSVATSLFDLIRQLGFKKIFLAGQDLAYTYREIHCTGTHHTDSWLQTTNRCQTLESINEDVFHKRHVSSLKKNNHTYWVDYVLGLYGSWFEKAIEKLSVEVINLGDVPSYIEGVKNISRIEQEALLSSQISNRSSSEMLRFQKALKEGLPLSSLQKDKAFIEELSQINECEDYCHRYPFINKIGRKFTILAERKKVSGAKENEILDLQKKKTQEQKNFIEKLTFRMKSILESL